jgi:hypothetical protein
MSLTSDPMRYTQYCTLEVDLQCVTFLSWALAALAVNFILSSDTVWSVHSPPQYLVPTFWPVLKMLTWTLTVCL